MELAYLLTYHLYMYIYLSQQHSGIERFNHANALDNVHPAAG